MNVAELIEKLKAMPLEKEAVTIDYERYGITDVIEQKETVLIY